MRYPLLIFLLALFESCDYSNGKTPPHYSLPHGYRLEAMEKLLLSEDLEEVSGLAWHRDELLAIEDESSIIYRLDPETGKIRKKKKFEKNKDIEDLLVRGDTAWVLRSNGNLYRVVDFREKDSQTVIYPFPRREKRDLEAILANPNEPFIWLFCKVCEWDEDPSRSSFFRFHLETMQFDSLPAGKIERSQLSTLMPQQELEELKIQPSAAAIHPLTGEYFLLSSTGKWLMTLDGQMKPSSVHTLDPSLFKQPEGITFAPDGTLYISNEARDGRANILIFSYRP
ncbi:SdiA-regulated domain-containing protein [Algoriphagus sp. H41]|uniref:SdiA-regulated domain-containing protein n=1 Tax=Algoriphagus oliviformis TaxID=2811231 RepID=A0ABS3CAX4_9BACT|nr:SdiA-regulated domain-containing protein [Algoriphagus oliviformis]MBN7812784.1 SdiA-regulated domain-containing protein [Algoriphagus oliviformis]